MSGPRAGQYPSLCLVRSKALEVLIHTVRAGPRGQPGPPQSYDCKRRANTTRKAKTSKSRLWQKPADHVI